MPRYLLSATLTSVMGVLATPALAQGAGGGAEFLTEAPNTFRVSKAKGVAVIGQDHTRLGSVEDLLIDRDGKVTAVVIGVGGVLGMGGRNVAVPYGQVLWNTGDVTRQSDLGASTAPTPRRDRGRPHPSAGPDAGRQISNEVLNATAEQKSGDVSMATGSVAPAEKTERATVMLVPADGSLRNAEIRATKAEIDGAPEFKLR
jgi:sporulation protein YlmC with PRC-barrel domain